jgi:hypothetical protein
MNLLKIDLSPMKILPTTLSPKVEIFLAHAFLPQPEQVPE